MPVRCCCKHRLDACLHTTLVTTTIRQAACLYVPCVLPAASPRPHTCAPALAPPPQAPQPPSHPQCPPVQAQAHAELQLQPHEPHCHRCCHHSLQQAGAPHATDSGWPEDCFAGSASGTKAEGTTWAPTPPTDTPVLTESSANVDTLLCVPLKPQQNSARLHMHASHLHRRSLWQ